MSEILTSRVKICCVSILYRPDLMATQSLLSSLNGQIDQMYLIDNSEVSDAAQLVGSLKLSFEIKIIALGQNVGVATAQNIGIRESIADGFDYLILSDQDTIYPNKFSIKMLNLIQNNNNVCCISPALADSKDPSFVYPFKIVSAAGGKKIIKNPVGNFEVYECPASGMFMRIEHLKKIGLMNDDLFIDFVDLEWCWRARSRGYIIMGASNIVIHHNLGDRLLSFFGKRVNWRQPVRHYYITRNALYLAINAKYLPNFARLKLFSDFLKYYIAYPILFSPRLINFKMVTRALLDGVRGKMGEFKSK